MLVGRPIEMNKYRDAALKLLLGTMPATGKMDDAGYARKVLLLGT